MPTSEVFAQSKWIWTADNTSDDDFVLVRRVFDLVKKPRTAIACIAVTGGHYDLFVNGQPVVLHGGVAGCFDQVDIAHALAKGPNAIAMRCHHRGHELSGLLFACEELALHSDDKFLVTVDPALRRAENPRERELLFDGTVALSDFASTNYVNTSFGPATVYADFGDEIFGTLTPNALPQLRFGAKPLPLKPRRDPMGHGYVIQLPHLMQFLPQLEFVAVGGGDIVLETDRRTVPAGVCSGAEPFVNRRIRLSYRDGANSFVSPLTLVGEQLRITIADPTKVKIKKISYRPIAYDTQMVGAFACNAQNAAGAFATKVRHTLIGCMHKRLCATADRGTMTMIGDASLAAAQSYLMASTNIDALVGATLDYYLSLNDGSGVLCSAPGVEVIGQSLLAVTEYGIVAEYFRSCNYADTARATAWANAIAAYLELWQMSESGLINPRVDGGQRWFDDFFNVDGLVLENAMYYSACRQLQRLARAAGTSFEWVDRRMACIEQSFHAAFWREQGYGSSSGLDDRANAWAILAHLVPAEHNETVAMLLRNVFNASPYMEGFVLMALCAIGNGDQALKRMNMRYEEMLASSSTVGEDFNCLGSRAHVRGGMPIVALLRCVAGVQMDNGAITIRPCTRALPEVSWTVACGDETISGAFVTTPANVIEISIDNRTSLPVTLDLRPELIGSDFAPSTNKLNRGRNKFSIVPSQS